MINSFRDYKNSSNTTNKQHKEEMCPNISMQHRENHYFCSVSLLKKEQ